MSNAKAIREAIARCIELTRGAPSVDRAVDLMYMLDGAPPTPWHCKECNHEQHPVGRCSFYSPTYEGSPRQFYCPCGERGGVPK